MDWLKEILGDAYTDDIGTKVSKAVGERFVSRADFNTLNETKKTLTKQISERDNQLEELKNVDAAGLQAEITRLQEENEAASKKFEESLAAMKLDHALDTAILGAKGKNTKAIKALLQADKLKLKDDGSIDGLDLEALKTSDPYLFDAVENKRLGTETGAGGNGGSGDGTDFSKMSYSEMCAYAQANPNVKFD